MLVTDKCDADLREHLARLKQAFGDRAYCALTRRFRPNDAAIMRKVANEAAAARVPTVATGRCSVSHARAADVAGRGHLYSPQNNH